MRPEVVAACPRVSNERRVPGRQHGDYRRRSMRPSYLAMDGPTARVMNGSPWLQPSEKLCILEPYLSSANGPLTPMAKTHAAHAGTRCILRSPPAFVQKEKASAALSDTGRRIQSWELFDPGGRVFASVYSTSLITASKSHRLTRSESSDAPCGLRLAKTAPTDS